VKHTLPLLLGLSLTLQAQSANPLSTEIKSAYSSVKINLLQSAEKMPEDGYGFKPTPDIRSFAEVLGHVVSAQMHACSAALGGGMNAGMTKGETKSEVLTALKAAFDECDKAYDALTDASAAEMIQSPRGARSRLGILAGNVAHDNEQYGILSVYMRLKGVIPPSSESAGRKK
jgi:DinB superfamily